MTNIYDLGKFASVALCIGFVLFQFFATIRVGIERNGKIDEMIITSIEAGVIYSCISKGFTWEEGKCLRIR